MPRNVDHEPNRKGISFGMTLAVTNGDSRNDFASSSHNPSDGDLHHKTPSIHALYTYTSKPSYPRLNFTAYYIIMCRPFPQAERRVSTGKGAQVALDMTFVQSTPIKDGASGRLPLLSPGGNKNSHKRCKIAAETTEEHQSPTVTTPDYRIGNRPELSPPTCVASTGIIYEDAATPFPNNILLPIF